MTLQYSTSARNESLAGVVGSTALGSSPVMKIRTGAPPATCATADSGTVLATLNLPTTAFGTPTAGSVSKSGTWQDASADAAGTAGHFRIYQNDGTTCVIQGTVTATGGGGDLELDNTSIAAGQNITISTFQIDDNNA